MIHDQRPCKRPTDWQAALVQTVAVEATSDDWLSILSYCPDMDGSTINFKKIITVTGKFRSAMGQHRYHREVCCIPLNLHFGVLPENTVAESRLFSGSSIPSSPCATATSF